MVDVATRPDHQPHHHLYKFAEHSLLRRPCLVNLRGTGCTTFHRGRGKILGSWLCSQKDLTHLNLTLSTPCHKHRALVTSRCNIHQQFHTLPALNNTNQPISLFGPSTQRSHNQVFHLLHQSTNGGQHAAAVHVYQAAAGITGDAQQQQKASRRPPPLPLPPGYINCGTVQQIIGYNDKDWSDLRDVYSLRYEEPVNKAVLAKELVDSTPKLQNHVANCGAMFILRDIYYGKNRRWNQKQNGELRKSEDAPPTNIPLPMVTRMIPLVVARHGNLPRAAVSGTGVVSPKQVTTLVAAEIKGVI
ncbi:hypothetical protein G7K_1996-t1 [Saitoella complicata NRRL Y-17804]|uniref:Uncharacterized protein n=1 Tax=Saitoella complicata (strain BCRC 22490 / CBS 7301 / JCM 7358 / NBRC 10748 / NRRL Y-17804) TaxID=698492 RepID=A0A0E9NDB2_SAICN|nr:hypothetical protein G7K_1996-t1 [Saitoella complicata NRRL Y-17804]